MKKTASLILGLLLALGVSAQTAKVVTIAEFTHPPFAYQGDSGKTALGAEITFMTAVLKDHGYQAQFSFVPFPRALENLKGGSADIGPLLQKTPEREEFALYSAVPVFNIMPVLVVRADSPLKQVTSPADLKGLKIGFAAGQNAPAFFADSGLPAFELASGENITDQNLKKLQAKRFDAFIDLNAANVSFAIKASNLRKDVRVLPIPGPGSPVYILVSKKSRLAKELTDIFNKTLADKSKDFQTFLQAELD